MGEHPDTLYYHTFAPEITVVTDADGVVVSPIEVRVGRLASLKNDELLIMTTDNRGEPTPQDVQDRAIEQLMTYLTVSWYGKQVMYT
jgi:outer membrane lipopolysaccharide assembly protein LptE/RlpB